MQTTEALKRTIKSAGDLLSIVKTMKALAAVSIRQYQKAVESLTDYNRTVEMGLHVLLKTQPNLTFLSKPQPVRRLGAIVFGSDQGLCGQLNEQIATHAIAEMDILKVPVAERTILTAGMRVMDYIEDTGHKVEEVLTTPGSTAGITPMVQEIIMVLENWRFQKRIDHFVLYYNKYLSGASYRPITVQLLPVDPAWLKDIVKKKWPSRSLPVFTMDPNMLLSTLIREYLFVSLYRAFAESLASENASRLASMQNAEKNIEERLQELHVHYHRQRQMTITEELLDIVAGFEALEEQVRLSAASMKVVERGLSS